MMYNRGITNEQESKTSVQKNRYIQNQRVQPVHPQKEQFYESEYEPTYDDTRPEPEQHDVLYEPFVRYRVVSRLAFGP